MAASGSSTSKPIIVGVTRSEESRNAVRWAADLAERRGVTLHLLHVLEWPSALEPRPGEDEARAAERAGTVWSTHLRAGGQSVLRTAELLARGIARTVPVTTELVPGRPGHVLREAAEGASLLAIGKRTPPAWEAALEVGGLAASLVGHLPCPLAVIRGDGPEPRALTVVVGVDGSPVSDAAVAFAFEQASLLGAELLAVEVRGPRAAAQPDFLDESLLDLSESLAGWCTKYPDVEVRQEILTGSPARMLATAAEHAHLLVVGTRGRGGFRGSVLGSTSRVLVHTARVPLVVVPPVPGG